MIKTVGLSKKYGDFWAVRDLSLNLEAGEIYGFLGPNGAGKTTTILMILSILRPQKGEIFLFGNQIKGCSREVRARIGVVSEKQYLYPEMTMREYLEFFGELYRVKGSMKRIERLSGQVKLEGVLDKRLGTFSRGMQQKVGFVRALLHEPDLLILDEPVSGLDPMGIRQARELIIQENKRGKTVFISSHLLSEVEKLCHRVGIINHGQLVAEDRMDNLVRRLSEEIELEVELTEENTCLNHALNDLAFIRDFSVDGRFLQVRMRTNQDYRKDLVQFLISQGHVPVGIRTKPMSLEDVFISITTENISFLTRTDE